MNCKICENKAKNIFQHHILNKFWVNYFHCELCDFIQTEEPYWLEEAYMGIEDQDFGRNEIVRNKLNIILPRFFDIKGKFLDFAGGIGMLTKMMREKGFDFYWSDKYCRNIFAKGFEHKGGVKYEALTTIECFEHFVNPIESIQELFSLSDSIIFTTLLLPKKMDKNWWYFVPEQGQHISFYSVKTLEKIATQFGANFYSDGYIHLLTKRPLELRKKNFKISLMIFLNKIFGRKKQFSKYGDWYEILRLNRRNNP